jgi:hypothetical protein
VDTKEVLADASQQFVTPMSAKLKTEWDKEFVR